MAQLHSSRTFTLQLWLLPTCSHFLCETSHHLKSKERVSKTLDEDNVRNTLYIIDVGLIHIFKQFSHHADLLMILGASCIFPPAAVSVMLLSTPVHWEMTGVQ